MAVVRPVPDAVSDVLPLVRMRSKTVCANDFAAPFSLSLRGPSARFHIAESGSAFLRLERKSPVRVESGDLVILPLGGGHVLSSDSDLPPVPINHAAAQNRARTSWLPGYWRSCSSKRSAIGAAARRDTSAG